MAIPDPPARLLRGCRHLATDSFLPSGALSGLGISLLSLAMIAMVFIRHVCQMLSESCGFIERLSGCIELPIEVAPEVNQNQSNAMNCIVGPEQNAEGMLFLT